MSGGFRAEKVVVLDRDGPIIVHRGYLPDPQGLVSLRRPLEGCAGSIRTAIT